MLIPATGRQGELTRRTFAGIRCRPQPSAMGVDNRATDRQAHTQAVRLGRIEGLEEMVQALRINPRTRVLHCDHDVLRLISTRSNQQRSWALADTTHGLDSVHD